MCTLLSDSRDVINSRFLSEEIVIFQQQYGEKSAKCTASSSGVSFYTKPSLISSVQNGGKSHPGRQPHKTRFAIGVGFELNYN